MEKTEEPDMNKVIKEKGALLDLILELLDKEKILKDPKLLETYMNRYLSQYSKIYDLELEEIDLAKIGEKFIKCSLGDLKFNSPEEVARSIKGWIGASASLPEDLLSYQFIMTTTGIYSILSIYKNRKRENK